MKPDIYYRYQDCVRYLSAALKSFNLEMFCKTKNLQANFERLKKLCQVWASMGALKGCGWGRPCATEEV